MADFFDQLNDALTGRYRVERELGRGGAAIIFLAHDLKHDRKVALKVLRPDLALSLGSDRFLREIKIAARLSHPHVLPVHDSGDHKGFLYYVMPFVDGESLRERLEERGQLDIDDVVSLLHDLLDALQHAHQRGIVHRDIKPGNVMLMGRHALVMDFGVAKALSAAVRPETDDSLGVVLGTPTYMAPEQASADPNVDHRADIYAVGAVAYEMLTGQPPFPGTTAQQVLAAHVTETPRPVQALRPDVPPVLAHLVMRCLEKDPSLRYQTADETLEVLDSLTPRTSRVRSSGVTTEETTIPVFHRRRKRWAAASVVLAILALVVAVMVRGPAEVEASGRPVIVVLPFENLGAAEDQFFASGITDAIAARLARLGSLGVISRTSASQFDVSSSTAREIGDALRVDYILEGTIQRERPGDPTSRVRIIPQLIRVSDETNMWASVYDEDMTDIFRVQSDIAERVARALDVALLEPERASIGRRPTSNLEAYDLYLRGHDYLVGNAGNGDANARRIAIDFLERALALDGQFALAWAELSLAHIWLYHNFVDPSSNRLAMAQASVDTAMLLAPEEPTVHLAMGHFYFWGAEPNPVRALREFEQVTEREPNNAYARSLMAELLAATDQWDRALENAVLAADLDPREPEWAVAAGTFHLLARRYDEATEYLDRAIALTPDYGDAYRAKMAVALRGHGDVGGARDIVTQMLQHVSRGEVAMALIDVAPGLVAGGEYDSIIDGLIPASISGPMPFDYLFVKAEFYRLRGRPAQARAYYDSLRTAVNDIAARREADQTLEMFLSRAFAGLGDRKQASFHAGRVEQFITESTDQVASRVLHESLVWVYALVGDYEAATDHLEHLVAMPSLISLAYLRVAYLPEGLREYARFQAIINGPVIDR